MGSLKLCPGRMTVPVTKRGTLYCCRLVEFKNCVSRVLHGSRPESWKSLTMVEMSWFVACDRRLLYLGRGRAQALQASDSILDSNIQSLQKVCPHGVVTASVTGEAQRWQFKSGMTALAIMSNLGVGSDSSEGVGGREQFDMTWRRMWVSSVAATSGINSGPNKCVAESQWGTGHLKTDFFTEVGLLTGKHDAHTV